MADGAPEVAGTAGRGLRLQAAAVVSMADGSPAGSGAERHTASEPGGPAAGRGRERCPGSGGPVWRPGVVDVVGDRIVHAGPLDTAPPPPGPVRQLPGVVVPGLVNAHAHSAMTLLRGVGDGMALEAWLEQAVWPREAHLSADDVYWGTSLGCAEMLRCGVTTTTETYFHDQAVVDAVVDAGMRAVVTPGILDVAGPGGTGRWQAMLDRACALHAEADGRAGLVRVGFGPHAAYSLPPEGLVAVARAAQSVGALVSIHLAETAAEGRALEETYRRSVPALLADLGVFDGPVVAAHGVWLSDDDLDLLARHRVAVAHCPQSNAKLGSGVARLTAMLAAGLAVALGTDGPASNDDLDLWEELRLAALLARLQAGDPAALSAGEALALATRGGAEALGLAVGCIEAGRLADLVHLRVDDPRFVPLVADDDLVRHLVWSSSSHLVTDVWVAGRQVVVDGRVRTVDVPRACREVQARALRLADAVGAADRPPGPTTGRP